MIFAIDHAAGEGRFSISSASDCVGQFGSGKGVMIAAGVDLVAVDALILSADVTCTHRVLACSQPPAASGIELVVQVLDGTMHRKKMSYGLVASAKRKRWILPLGK